MEENKILKKINEILLIKKKALFQMPKKYSPVILCFSGGLDSSCLWFLLVKKYKLKVYPVFFYFNNLSLFLIKIKLIKIEKFFKKNFPDLYHPIIFYKLSIPFSFNQVSKDEILTNIPLVVSNLLRFDSQKIFGKVFNKKNISSFVSIPARTMIFSVYSYLLLHKLQFFLKKQIKTIFFGIVPEDIIIRDQTLTQIRAINLALTISLGDFQLQIAAPIDKRSNFFYSKEKIVEFAHKNKFPVFNTFSCINNRLLHCGQCYNCLTRRKTFKDLKIEDKTFYFSNFKNFSFFSKFNKKISTFLINLFKNKLK